MLQRHETAIQQLYSSPTIPSSAPLPSSAEASLSQSPALYSPNIPRSDAPFLHRSFSTPSQTLYSASVASIGESATPPTSQLGGTFERTLFSYSARDQEYLEMLTNFQDTKKVPLHIATSNGSALGLSISTDLPDYDLCYSLCD